MNLSHIIYICEQGWNSDRIKIEFKFIFIFNLIPSFLFIRFPALSSSPQQHRYPVPARSWTTLQRPCGRRPLRWSMGSCRAAWGPSNKTPGPVGCGTRGSGLKKMWISSNIIQKGNYHRGSWSLCEVWKKYNWNTEECSIRKYGVCVCDQGWEGVLSRTVVNQWTQDVYNWAKSTNLRCHLANKMSLFSDNGEILPVVHDM